MNFFQQLNEKANGFKKVTIIVVPVNGKLTVSFLPDTASEFINEKMVPVTLTGTADELDAEFFTHITKVVETIAGVQSNVEQVDKQLKEAEKEKPKASKKETPPKSDPKPSSKKEAKGKKEEVSNTSEEPKQEQQTIEFS